MSRALFLDRDGTLIVDKNYLHKPDEIELIAETTEALQRALEKDYKLFLFTNQSGIGRGMFTLEDAHKCNQRMLEMIGLGENLFTEICIAPEAPEQASKYRKPSPTFILEMIAKYELNPKNCWMIGDRDADLEAGLSAGIKSVYVRTGKAISDKVNAYIQNNQAIACETFADFARSYLQ